MADLATTGNAAVTLLEQLVTAEAEVSRLRERIAEQERARAGEEDLEHRPDLAAAYETEMVKLRADLMLAEFRHTNVAAELRAKEAERGMAESRAQSREARLIAIAALLVTIIKTIYDMLK